MLLQCHFATKLLAVQGQSIYTKKTGPAMDPPPPSVFFPPEIFLQYTARAYVLDVLKHRNMVGYCEYVGGALSVWDKRITENKNVLQQFNNIYCTLNFTTVEENENSLNSVDGTLRRMEDHINY